MTSYYIIWIPLLELRAAFSVSKAAYYVYRPLTQCCQIFGFCPNTWMFEPSNCTLDGFGLKL